MTWTPITDLPAARQSAAVAGFEDGGWNYAVIYGGSATSPPTATATAYLYAVSPNNYPATGTMPAARMGAAAVSWNGLNYVFGGWIPGTGVFAQTWQHDPIADVYTTLTPMPAARLNHRAMVVGDFAYIFGGQDSSLAVVDDVWIYDLLADSWATGTPMPTGVTEPGIARFGDMLYLVGGNDGSADSDALQVYDTVTDSWTAGAPMLTARSGLVVGFNADTLWAVAGLAGASVLDVTERYDVPTDTWADDAAGSVGYLPSARYQLGWWQFQGYPVANFFVFGGRNAVIPQDDTWRVDLYNPGLGWIFGAGPFGTPVTQGWE